MRKDAPPDKPYPDFPLFPHACGQWAKKVKGRLRYFGVWADPDAALQRWLDEKDALLAGREPRRAATGHTVADVVNAFLTAKRAQADAGELTPRMWSDYHHVCEDIVATFGRERAAGDLGQDDFARLRAALAKRLGPVALGVFVQRVKTVFKWAWEAGILETPIRYGQSFDKPSKRTVRLGRRSRMLTAAECRALVAMAKPPLDAMVLLGLNAGFGQSDCSELPMGAVDLAGGWITFPRPKTGVARRCPLWPETAEAIRLAIASRPSPRDSAHAGLVFLTKYGQPWVRFTDRGDTARGTRSDSVSMEFRKVAKRAGVTVPGGFYTLRHVFRTVADEAKDPPAADLIMGHQSPGIAATYRETISNARLQAVTDHVREWCFGKNPEPPPERRPR